jgi:DNA-binding transcriptional LysR family regulator
VASRAPAQWEFLGYDELQQDAPQQDWLDKLRGARRYSVRSNDLLTLLQAAVGGCGVGVFPRYAAARAPGLVVLEPACPVRRKLWLVMHDDVRRAPHVRAVADEIIAMFEQE